MAKTYDDDEEEFGGFGREAVEEAAKRPTYASTQGQVGERERREEAIAGPLKPEKKRVVTKEEMKKAGFDNLRDFLNAERGLTRKKDSVKPKVEPVKTEAPVKKEAPKTEARKPGRSAAANRGRPKTESTPVKVAPGATAVERMRNLQKQRFGEKNKFGMKKGGMVSSASKRADGIAKKGKTRGKMV